MVVSRIKTTLFSVLLLASFEVRSAINPRAMSGNSSQMVNLNLQIKSNNKTVKSDLTMPFYQTAEFERKVGNKNVLIEMSPRHGKNSDEIALEMKFYKTAGAKAFYKKAIVAKVNEESTISFRGMSVRVKPAFN